MGVRALSLPPWAVRRLGEMWAQAVHGSTAGGVWRAARRARVVTSRLAERPMLSRESAGRPADEAVHWRGRLNIGGRMREALVCQPAASVTFRLTAPAGARLCAHCGVVPDAWARSPGIIFEIGVERARSGRGARLSRTMLTRSRLDHRLWRPLRVAIPPPADAQDDLVIVRLSTALPAGSNGAQARAVFGDPVVEWPQPAGRRLVSARAFLSRVRAEGPGEAIRCAEDPRAGIDPQARFDEWIRLNTPRPEQLAELALRQAAFTRRPTISIITPVSSTDPRWLRACIESVRAQIYPEWELCLCGDRSPSATTVAVLTQYADDRRIRTTRLNPNGGISAASNAALAMATGEFVARLDHDDELPPEALYEVVRRLNRAPESDVLYSDEDTLELDGRRTDPFFKPDWSPELLLSYMYAGHLLVARRSLVVGAGGFRTNDAGAQDYDLLLRLAERTTRIEHIDRILYHRRKVPGSSAAVTTVTPRAVDAGRRALEDAMTRRGWEADVLPGAGPGIYRVKRRIRGAPLVSIVIPTRGGRREPGTDLVARCLQSLRLTSYPNVEVIVAADEGWTSEAVRTALSGLRHTILPYHAPDPATFNFPHKLNAGAAAASGEHLVLLNDDIEVTDGGWLEAMLEFSQDGEIGAVGARLRYPDGRLQHVGMLLGVAGIATHAFHQYPGSTPGYFGSNVVIRNASAVTAACLMTRAAVYREMGGFDESMPVDFNDLEYCLRLHRAGYRIVFTPYAELTHHESASFGPRTQAADRAAEMRRRWAPALAHDPYYNRNLSRQYLDYRIEV